MFFPPEVMISSFFRSTMVGKPPVSSVPRSPVCSQPSRSRASAVPAGSRQYRRITSGPRTRTSPSPASRTSMPGQAVPTAPVRARSGWLTVAALVSSVIPQPSAIGSPSAWKNSMTAGRSGRPR